MNFRFGYLLFLIVFITVMACWFAFVAILVLRKQRVKTAEAKRDRASDYGLVLQILSYAVIWFVRREPFTPITRSSDALNWIFAAVTIILAVGSIWIIMAAINTLGKEWSVRARLIEDHKLATTGPYRFARHPIYTGMLGMLFATGLAISRWPALVIAIVVFLIGTMIRIKSEERLLRAAFGAEFDNYSRRVSAIIPGIF